MFKIQTVNTISSAGLKQFSPELYQIDATIDAPDAILVRSQDMHHFAFPSSIKVVGRAGAGVNNIPIDALTKCGIPVLNTPGANANAVREMVIAAMFLASRNIFPAWDYVRHLKNADTAMQEQIEKDKKQFVGFELLGKTLGIIGLGNVGVKVANAAIHLGMRVMGYDPTIHVNRAWELSAEVQQAQSIEHLLMESDFISIHVPLTDDTKHMLNAETIALMKTGVVVLNFARDNIIDHAALLTALQEKKIFAFVTDFPSAELKDHPQVISLPHLGASTREAEENCAIMIVKQVRDFLENGNILHSVNFPTVDIPRSKASVRLAIANANIPNMVAQISATLAAAGLNIVSLLNKSQGDVAYTLLDVSADINDALLKKLSSIDGVIQVRKIP